MSTYFCEDPAHQGDRRHSADYSYRLTIDIVHASGEPRLMRRGPRGYSGGQRLCRACAERWKAAGEASEIDVTDNGYVPVPDATLFS